MAAAVVAMVMLVIPAVVVAVLFLIPEQPQTPRPLQALLLYLSGSFYLENLTDLSNVCVNGRVLSKGELWPLCFGDRVELARLRLEFGQSKQLYLD